MKFPTSTSKSINHSTRSLFARFWWDSENVRSGLAALHLTGWGQALPFQPRSKNQKVATPHRRSGLPEGEHSPHRQGAQSLKNSQNAFRFQDTKENKHAENFSHKHRKCLGILWKYPVSRTQSRINQNVTKVYSPKIIKLLFKSNKTTW